MVHLHTYQQVSPSPTPQLHRITAVMQMMYWLPHWLMQTLVMTLPRWYHFQWYVKGRHLPLWMEPNRATWRGVVQQLAGFFLWCAAIWFCPTQYCVGCPCDQRGCLISGWCAGLTLRAWGWLLEVTSCHGVDIAMVPHSLGMALIFEQLYDFSENFCMQDTDFIYKL